MHSSSFKVVLISTYEMGRQPFGLASPAAWLRREGAEVACIDLAVEKLPPGAIESAGIVAFYLPMHTATRLAIAVLEKVRQIAPKAHLCCYGLYAPVNESYLRKLGVQTILGGEFEEGLVSLLRRIRAKEPSSIGAGQPEPLISLHRQQFLVPDRSGLVPLENYAGLRNGNEKLKTVGYTEASRGCKHLCRHCPIVPVYNGQFRIVQKEIVLEDIRWQAAGGAEHITFGDPDFFNGIRHAIEIVAALHQEFPHLTYDATIKIEHLLKHRNHLLTLRDTGCLFVTSAVESVDDNVLARLDKGHTREDFFRVAELFQENELTLAPTFVPFTPWTTPNSYLDLLHQIARLGFIENVAPIQLAIRLLIPAGSRLLELPEIRALVGPFAAHLLTYPWRHPLEDVDGLQKQVQDTVKRGEGFGWPRREIFERIWALAHKATNRPVSPVPEPETPAPPRVSVPYLNEPWYC